MPGMNKMHLAMLKPFIFEIKSQAVKYVLISNVMVAEF